MAAAIVAPASASIASIGAVAAPPVTVRVARAASVSHVRRGVEPERGLAELAVLRERARHDLVGRPVVDACVLRERLGDVRGEVAGGSSDRVEGQALGDRGGEVDRARGELDRAADLAVGVEQVVGPARGRALGGEHAGRAAEQRAGRAADDGERVRVALLWHQRAGAAERVADVDEAELVAGVELEVLGEAARGGGGQRGVEGRLGDVVGAPHRVAGVGDRGVEAEQVASRSRSSG